MLAGCSYSFRLAIKELSRFVDHLQIERRNRCKSTAFKQHAFLSDCLRGEQRLAVAIKEHGRRKSNLHQMQRHDPVVDGRECCPTKHNPIDLKPTSTDVVKKPLDQLLGRRPGMTSGVQ